MKYYMFAMQALYFLWKHIFDHNVFVHADIQRWNLIIWNEIVNKKILKFYESGLNSNQIEATFPTENVKRKSIKPWS